MTPKEFCETMLELRERYQHDEERVHCAMDDVMCELLIELGFCDGVEVFRQTPKWYA